MPGFVTYSKVSDTRISFWPSGVMRWRSLSPSNSTMPPSAICTGWFVGDVRIARVQLVVEPARRFVDHADQQRVTTAVVVRRVVVPADVVAGLRVVIQRVRVRIVVRRQHQLVARDFLEERDQRLRAIQLGDVRRLLVDRMTAHAAALLVAGQVCGSGRPASRGRRRPASRARRPAGRCRDKGTKLARVVAAQAVEVELADTVGHGAIRVGRARAGVPAQHGVVARARSHWKPGFQ